MYKSTISIISICLLSACGSGSSDEPVNPFSPVAEQTDSQSPEQIQSDPITATVEQTIVEPIVQPVQQPIVQPAPVRGPCVDTAPVNDGFGWDGVGTCLTPIVATVEPEPVTDPVIEPVVIAAPVIAIPVIFSPETQAQVDLEELFWDEDFLTNSVMICDVVTFNQTSGRFENSVSGGTSWHHFPDGTGETFSFFANDPTPFTWQIQDGVYTSDTSPLNERFAEVLNLLDGRTVYQLWNTETPLEPHFQCDFR